MRSDNKIINNLLHIKRMRRFVDFNVSYLAVKSQLRLITSDTIEKPHRVLVLSPHPDDDMLGCGGTLRLHVNAGSTITTLYLTNGKNESRVAEAASANKILGIKDFRFWDYGDNRLPVDKKTIAALIELISEVRPETIFVPSFFDSNNDHIKTAEILAHAVDKTKFTGRIMSYEIWQPLFANRLVKIDEVVKTKKRAIACHSSQLRDRPYMDALLGLNQYRGGMFNTGHYAEAFFSCKKELYIIRHKLLNS